VCRRARRSGRAIDASGPILSIVTPVFNGATFLRRCLESVASQDVEPGTLEHVVMDGGSTDGSVEIIREFAGRLAHWESGRDAGQSDAINRGIDRARGEWATWINADDWYEPGALRAVVDELRAQPGTDLLVARAQFVDERGRAVWKPIPPDPPRLADLLRVRSMWFAGRSIAQPEAFFRRSLFHAVGGLNPDNHHSMDHELWLAMIEHGARCRSIDRMVANVGVHAGQKTADNREAARAIVRFARPFAERGREALGAQHAGVCAELDEVERRIEIVDRLCEAWDAPPRAVERVDPSWLGAVRRTTAGARTRVLERARTALGPRGADRITIVSFDAEGIEEEVREALGAWATIDVCAPADAGPAAAGPGGALLVETCLFGLMDPGAIVRAPAEGLAAPGVLVVLAEPMASGHLRKYLAWLRKLATDRITADGAAFLGEAQDDLLKRLSDPGVSSLLRAPGARGLDLLGLFREHAPELTGFAYEATEGLDHLPAAPFPCVGRGREMPAAGWQSAAWRRG